MEPQLLVFDLDGTLINSRADLATGINHMRKQFKLPPLSEEIISGYVGDGVHLLVERALEDASADVDEAMRIYTAYYAENLVVHTYLYPGVAEGIVRLADAGFKLAMLTNKPGPASRIIMSHFGLTRFFEPIIGGGDCAHLKPAPDGIFLCQKAAGMQAANTWMIGDHYTDLAVAENAGIKSAFVRYGFGEERGYKPTAYFASFPELVGYFVGP